MQLLEAFRAFSDEIAAVPTASPSELIFEVPLYEAVKMESVRELRSLFGGSKSKIDGHCVECGRDSVFHSESVYGHDDDVPKSSRRDKQIFEIMYSCQRDNTHKINLFAEFEWVSYYESIRRPLGNASVEKIIARIQKIGQLPSHADIAVGSLSAFRSIMEQLDRREFIRANGLAAHGVNIGAFVYLRRVFERLLDRARKRAEAEIDEAEYREARVSEKIELLSEYLPEFMVKNRRVYSVLSVGIHELSEDECAKYYTLVRDSSLLMLEQEKDLKEKQKMEDDLSKAVAAIDLAKDKRP